MSGPTRTLQIQSQKMLASTVQFSTYDQTPPTRPRQTRRHPRRGDGGTRNRTALTEKQLTRLPRTSPLPQDPTACLRPVTPHHPVPRPPRRTGRTGSAATRPAELVSVPPSSSTPDTRGPSRLRHRHGLGTALDHTQRGARPVLLRKEVIQPHLPVRLPCYDFVPIADPAFDGSLPQGVGPPASGVTDFRDVTGGVYKARERIHRSVADLRLLATPTSWGRVADPNPN